MENYELYLEHQYNKRNGKFNPGHIPFNKGKKMTEWMDGRKIKRVLKYLEIGKKAGNKHLAGFNRIEIVGIFDGKLTAFKCAGHAEDILRAKGIKINRRNISKVCNGKPDKKGCVRLKAGGYRWFYAWDTEKYKNLIS